MTRDFAYAMVDVSVGPERGAGPHRRDHQRRRRGHAQGTRWGVRHHRPDGHHGDRPVHRHRLGPALPAARRTEPALGGRAGAEPSTEIPLRRTARSKARSPATARCRRPRRGSPLPKRTRRTRRRQKTGRPRTGQPSRAGRRLSRRAPGAAGETPAAPASAGRGFRPARPRCVEQVQPEPLEPVGADAGQQRLAFRARYASRNASEKRRIVSRGRLTWRNTGPPWRWHTMDVARTMRAARVAPADAAVPRPCPPACRTSAPRRPGSGRRR